MDLAAGTLVGNRYEILEALGAGPMGVVFLARDRDLQRKIALKVHQAHAGTEQLRREALAMAKLAHPNVVTVFEVGEHDGRTFVAMEYIAGTTLRAWLAEPRPPSEILDVLCAAGEGLVAAHEAGLVHRDFNPENVWIGTDGRARVTDFGLARDDGEAGAPAKGAHLSPEQAAGSAVDARADQYAFCAVAWAALVGAWPRDGTPTKQPRVRRVLERGLADDPAKRFGSMRDLLSALRGARSRRGLVLAIGAAVLVACGASAFAMWPRSDATAASCDGAGIAILTVGLDVPAQIAAAGYPDVAAATQKRLAAYRASFVDVAASVCRHGLVDHTWSPDLYRRGVTCLDQQRRLHVRLFANERPGHDWTSDLLYRVVRIDDETSCGDAQVLASAPALPDDPVVLEHVVQARVSIASALANYGPNRMALMATTIAAIDASPVRDQASVAMRLAGIRAVELQDLGRLLEGEAMYAKAYQLARAFDDPEYTLVQAANLVTVASMRLDDAATKNWLRNGLADAERVERRAPIAAGRFYAAAATIADGFGDPKETLAYLAKAFALFGDRPSRPLADAYLIRASAHIAEGNPTAATEDYQRGIAMLELVYGKDHPYLAGAKLSASAGYLALGNESEARTLAREGEAILERNPGLRTQDFAQLRLNLGVSYIATDHAKAHALLASAHDDYVALFGPLHPDVSLVDANLAYLAVTERKFELAATIARETLARMEQNTPKPHEHRGRLLLTLADAANGLHDYETAMTAAEASSNEYAVGDERRILSLVVAAMTANDTQNGERALTYLAKADALPTPTDPQLLGRLAYERGRAVTKRDRATAIQLLDTAVRIFREAQLDSWTDEATAFRAKLR